MAAGAFMLCNKENDVPDEINPAEEPATFADLPIQPTGSGVQDLEIAYEQMKLSQDDAAATEIPAGDATIPTEDGHDAVVSAAHPS